MSAATTRTATVPAPQFRLPEHAEATEPPEERGLRRDQVRLLVASPDRIRHRRFHDLPQLLHPGDLVVLNVSATLPAAVDVIRAGIDAPLHVSAELDDGRWVVEVRRPGNDGPATDVRPGEVLRLPGGQRLRVHGAYPEHGGRQHRPPRMGQRLWAATPMPAAHTVDYLARHGRPVHYAYLSHPPALDDLQNVYATEPGSAEMASAGRPFTEALLTRLVARGVIVAPVVLHTGVSSPESDEPPVPEPFTVPAATARLVNGTRAAGRRVIAVGTTVTRALETVADRTGRVHAAAGWTSLVLGPDRPARAVNGLVTGLHTPEASHLRLLQAVAGPTLVQQAYDAAVQADYRWHEFGDATLFWP